MFKQNFIDFCNKKGESPSFVCRQVGLAPATFSCWTEESIPRRATLQRIADYFGITVEDLLRDSNETTAPTPTVETAPSVLSPEFNDLLNRLTLQELREVQAFMEQKIKNRK
jgi:transcriptional regulator with XRE-family HTH domain